MENSEGKIIGIYHRSCVDGTVAAALLLKKFSTALLFPLAYGEIEDEIDTICEEIDETTTVYILDFSLQKDGSLEKLLSRNPKKIINIDHHISEKETLEKDDALYENFEYIFDNERSGATLTWKYLFESEPSLIIKFVEYGDLGKWDKDPRAEENNIYLSQYINEPQKMLEVLESPSEKILEEGKIISDYVNFLIERYAGKNDEGRVLIGGHKTLAFNATFAVQQIQSRLGRFLAEKYGETVLLYRISGGQVGLSFRGLEKVEPSARELAEACGGGGHRDSAGAGVQLEKFLEMLEK